MAEDTLYCEVHPEVETTLRCNKCNRLMCTDCAVRTPVGYRCKECVRGQQDGFYTAGNNDYVVAGAVAVVASAIGSFVLSEIGTFGILLSIFLGPAAGSAIARLVRVATQKRRGRYTDRVVLGGILVGGLVGALPVISEISQLTAQFPPGTQLPLNFWVDQLLPVLIFTGLAAAVAYSWFRYGR